MENSEVQQLALKELIERIDEEKDTLTRLRLNHAVSPLENPLKLKFTRRLVARLKTELQRRKLEGLVETESE